MKDNRQSTIAAIDMSAM